MPLATFAQRKLVTYILPANNGMVRIASNLRQPHMPGG